MRIVRAPRQVGQNLVELTLALTLLLWLALGLLDFGRVMYIYAGLTNGAREGARYAALVAPTCPTQASVFAVVRAEQPNLFDNPDLTDVLPNVIVDCSEFDRRKVTVTYRFKPVTFFIAEALDNPDGSLRIPLTTRATMPVTPQS
jgi:hypothetical protein